MSQKAFLALTIKSLLGPKFKSLGIRVTRDFFNKTIHNLKESPFMLVYPALFEKDISGGYVITFRDVPEAITQADNIEEAHEMALDALLTSLYFYFEKLSPIPEPSQVALNETGIVIPLSLAIKVAFLKVCIQLKLKPCEVARRLEILPQEATRLLSLHHKTKINTLANAFNALDYELTLTPRKKSE